MFNCAAGREEHCKQISLVCVRSARSVGHTGFAPTHGVCAFMGYNSHAPGCFAGELSKVGPGLHALPRSKPLRFRFSGTPQRHRLSWACVLCPSHVWAVQVTKCLASAHSPVGAVHLTTSPVPASEFPWLCSGNTISGVACVSSGVLKSSCDPPDRCQMSSIQGRLG